MDAVNELLADAKAIEEAGAFMIMVEGVPVSVCKYIRDNINIPIVGIGAGPECEIQGLIFQDMIGFTDWVPKFAKKFADLRTIIIDAYNTYAKECNERSFPDTDHQYNTVIEGIENLK